MMRQPVDFTGRWVLDLQASDSMDELLKVLGRSWVDRKISSKTETIQKITQTVTELTIQTFINTEIKAAKSAIQKSATFLNVKVPKAPSLGKIFAKTDVLSLDGSEQVKSTDGIALGKVLVRTVWSDDNQVLVSKTELNTQAGPGTLINTRFLENNDTMVLTIQLEMKNGTPFEPVNRIFKRKKSSTKDEE